MLFRVSPQEDPSIVEPARGTLLVASPRLLDPNFMHAVVLLCDHGPVGSYGVIVNRRASMTVGEIGGDVPLLAGRKDPVWLGGPVGAQQLQVLHTVGDTIPGSLPVLPGVQLGGDPDVLHKALQKADDAQAKFVVGYSGWGAKQLDDELREGAWVVCPGDLRFVFDLDSDTLWRRVLRSRGGVVAQLADVPPDPSWN
jgi:putative transcriptional regulator